MRIHNSYIRNCVVLCMVHLASISATRNGLEVGRSFYAGKIGSQSYFEWENSPSSYESWSTQFGGYEEKRGERVWIHNTKVSRRLPREFLICIVKFSQFYLFYYLLSCCSSSTNWIVSCHYIMSTHQQYEVCVYRDRIIMIVTGSTRRNSIKKVQ